MTVEALVSVTALLSFIANLVATERWVAISERRGLLARDLHKLGSVMAARVGGIPLTIIFITQASIISTLLGLPAPLTMLPIFFSSIGLVDDLIGLSNLEKIVLSGIPFLLLHSSFPPFEPFSSFLTHQLTLFLLGTYYVNSTNTFAGFNGLEAGTSLIISLALSMILLAEGEFRGSIYLLSLFLLLLSFLKYNWYPAKAFPGNVLTFLCGGAIATASFSYSLYWELVILSLPQGFDFLLKVISWGRTKEKVPTSVSSDGKLVAPPNLSLPSLLIRLGVREEHLLVILLLSIELSLALLLLINLPR
ncbi:MAG: hypothetical protein NZ992_03270 [Candidatus Korarchaeum sp.]|nr:hypothetical protein [Candidatus Korarchaeum sp.]MDW8036190.1 hypothetical protein [Candidatus Korarchaeum sp.]